MARADEPTPVIVTYELSKLRKNAYAQARNPKGYWIGEIVARIEDKKPGMRTPLKKPVTVQIHFIVRRDGKVLSKEIGKSSGIPAVDMIALSTLDKAAPFPPMPASLSDTEMAFTLPLRFR